MSIDFSSQTIQCTSHFIYIFSLEFTQSFGLLIRWPEDPQDKLLMFRLPGEEINRKELTEQIARLMADSKSSANTVSEIQGGVITSSQIDKHLNMNAN